MPHTRQSTPSADPRWRSLFKTAGYAAIAMLAIMAAQIVIYVAWPPPDTVSGFFALFQQNWLLGLLSMDLLYLVNNAVLILIYLALYAALKQDAEAPALIALVVGLVGIAAYYASNTAFEMLSLSGQYAAAAGEAQRAIYQGAGEGMLATYKGTAFDSYYILNAVSLLVFAVLILRTRVFARSAGVIALISGILMAIPSTAGTLGLIFSLASLVPWAVFLVLAARRFFQLGSAGARPHGSAGRSGQEKLHAAARR